MYCAISGSVPERPVVSRASGRIFERRLIEQYVSEHGTDPVTGESMTLDGDDLIEIVATDAEAVARPRPPTATSMPALLAAFQQEWDATALEVFELRRQLQQTRQELSAALYQNDAACRVITRLSKERDDARSALASVAGQVANGSGAAHVDDVEVSDAPEDGPVAIGEISFSSAAEAQRIVAIVEETQQTLSAARRQRKGQQPGTATAKDIAAWKRSTRDITPEEMADLRSELEPVANMYGQDSTGEVIELFTARHPSGRFKVTASYGSTALKIVDGPSIGSDQDLASIGLRAEPNCLEFHPDGNLLGIGCKDGQVHILSLISGKVEASIALGPEPKGGVYSLSFSENGYWLAIARQLDSSVAVWHLGKDALAAELPVRGDIYALRFDPSGASLAVTTSAGIDVRCYDKKQKTWTAILDLSEQCHYTAWLPEGRGLVAFHQDDGHILLE